MNADDRKPSSIRSLEVVNPNDKVAQLRQAFADEPAAEAEPGHPNQQSLIDRACDPARSPEQRAIEENVITALKTVYDPEIPVDVYELGLIYDIAIDPGGAVGIRMTLTAPGCPVAQEIVDAVEQKVRGVAGVTGCRVELTFDPPWSKERMSEVALLDLGLL